MFGAEFGDWILGLPVTAVTILKLIFGTLIGYWAIKIVREMDSSEVSGGGVQSPTDK